MGIPFAKGVLITEQRPGGVLYRKSERTKMGYTFAWVPSYGAQ